MEPKRIMFFMHSLVLLSFLYLSYLSCSLSTQPLLYAQAADVEVDAAAPGTGDAAEECANKYELATRPDDIVYSALAKECGAAQYFADEIVPGFHILCMTDDKVVVYKDGQGLVVTTWQRSPETAGTDDEYKALRSWAKAELGLELNFGLTRLNESSQPPGYRHKYPWQWFTADGSRKIKNIKQLTSTTPVFIFKGGAFIWPGVRVGHKQTADGLQGLSNITMLTVSMTPLVFEMEHFLSDDECDHIQSRSIPHMAPSPVSKMDHDLDKEHSSWRTSTTYFLSSDDDPKLQQVEERVADITRVPISHQEDAQVLRYELNQQYDSHHDYFNPAFYQTNEGIMRMIDGGRRNRMVTVFWYLSDVTSGGETVFPRVGGYQGYVDFKACDGLRVTPRRGKVAMFYSIMPDGRLDDYSLHGACPVREGTKWAANKWVWNHPFENA